MKHVWVFPLVAACCAAAAARGPEPADGKEYLKYEIPAAATAVEHTARPGHEYVVYEVYLVGDKQVGTRYYWDLAKTKLHSEELFAADKGHDRHGVQRAWHKNGLPRSEAPYKDGKMHGTFKQWDENGKLLGSFVMNGGTGTHQSWYPNGRTEEVRPYKGGKEDGEIRRYFDTGKPFQLITYRAGEAHGISYVWDRDGNLEAGYPRFYVRGERVAKDAYLKAAATDSSLPAPRAGDESR